MELSGHIFAGGYAVNLICQLTFSQDGIGYPCSLGSMALDVPVFSFFDELQFGPLTPPTIYFTGSCYPDVHFPCQESEVTQQRFVDISLPRSREIVWMHNKT